MRTSLSWGDPPLSPSFPRSSGSLLKAASFNPPPPPSPPPPHHRYNHAGERIAKTKRGDKLDALLARNDSKKVRRPAALLLGLCAVGARNGG